MQNIKYNENYFKEKLYLLKHFDKADHNPNNLDWLQKILN